MEFKIIHGKNGKELHFKATPDGTVVVEQLGNTDIPSDPRELFEFMTGKLKEHGLVPTDTVFRLNP